MRTVLFSKTIDTPLGSLVALADEQVLYFLGFADNLATVGRIKQLLKKINGTIIPGLTGPLISIHRELDLYFSHQLQTFTTPVYFCGTPFQKSVWHALIQIPYGTTRPYKEQASIIDNPAAYRAVGTAHGANNLPIIVPCHRITTCTGDLGGYNGGIERKQWLLDHEKRLIYTTYESMKKKSPLTTLRNVGPATLKDLELLGINSLEQLAQADPTNLYINLQKITGTKHDPCVWDVFAAIIHEAKTGEKTNWWKWSPIRKKLLNRS